MEMTEENNKTKLISDFHRAAAGAAGSIASRAWIANGWKSSVIMRSIHGAVAAERPDVTGFVL